MKKPTTILVRGYLSRDLGVYEAIRKQIGSALRCGHRVLLDIDSGGGDAIGVQSLAHAIYAKRSMIDAHISGVCASAAYYLAAACGRITAACDAAIGSIGAMAVYQKMPGQIVAKLSPLKNSGEDVQALVDADCERFLLDVAKFRGLKGDLESLSVACGAGAMMTARAALASNLIDEVEDMEDEEVQSQLDLESLAAIVPKILEKLEDVARKVDKVDERVGMLEEVMHKDKASEDEAVGEAEADAKKAEDQAGQDKMASVVECLIGVLRKDGHIRQAEEAGAVKLLAHDPSLFKQIFIDREPVVAQVRMSAATVNAAQPQTRDERARAYMQAAGCDYLTALAHEVEKEQ